MTDILITGLQSVPGSVLALGIVWLLTMIGLPIVRWTLGERAVPAGVSVGVLLQAVLVLVLLAIGSGVGRALAAAVLVAVGGWLLEFIGSRSGKLFGRYHYTDVLQPQIGHVPVVIPLAWIMMMPPAWAVAAAIVPDAGPLVFAIVAGIAFAAWDLFLDPQMVGWGFWKWDQSGGYFGIPFQNLFGWFIGATLLSLLVRLLLGPLELIVVPLLLVYMLTWMLETVGQLVFWNLKGSGITGCVGMGTVVFVSLLML